ncbi:transcriptional repressor [Candidatus Methylospira mobilis]|uniref:Transcriptional repressor n=1 Tax=Candidatus Methylospira mobilis TaxID=1808979 RepID=A0A5Q0BLW8_9GAMM|nr:transcriptional repressor [Candidatus Methylospira mobilis]QFY44760.1 transcriptional repressor [Candidatus Methylospira mobilis]
MTTSKISPHNHKRCIDSAMSNAEQLCAQRGLRLTPIRRKVFELIWESHQAVKAYDLLERIRPFEMSAKPPTVYRALEFLLDLGVIHRVESLNAFIGCIDSGRTHEQLLLICTECQQVTECSAPEVMGALAAEIRMQGFSARQKSIEIHGTCRTCAQNADTKDTLPS